MRAMLNQKAKDILYSIKARKNNFKEKHPWLAQNFWIITSLVLIFILAFFLRSYWNFGPATENGFLYVGTDPYYHQRIIEYIQAEHKHLTFDPMLNYPVGSANPRPPIFQWTTALIGYLLTPFFGGDVHLATQYSSTFAPVLWGSLMIFPIYFITTEMFNKKAGILASFLMAIMPEHIQSSGLGLFDHDQMVLFFILLTIFFYFKAIKTLKDRKYVVSWKKPKEIKEGVKNFWAENKVPVGFALISAISISTVALIWEGFPYLLAIVSIYYFAQLLINALRKEDSFGIAIITLILVGLPLLIILPYYNEILPNSLIAPFYIFVGIFGLTIFFVPTRDIPWLITVPFTIIVIGIALYILDYFYPTIANYLFSGMGYFIVSKVYSTIGEAQPADFGRMAYAYGVITFYLAFIGMVICALQYKKTWKKDRLFILIWSGTAIYMASAAIRFMDNATPIFAILGGFVLYEIIRRLRYDEMTKVYHSLRGDKLYALRKSIKLRHVFGALFIAFLILMPNLWSAVDAAIPSEIKQKIDEKIYDFLPGQTDVYLYKTDTYNIYLFTIPSFKPDNGTYEKRNKVWYLGAFGQSYLADYWQNSFAWLKEQDKNITAIENRPGFISWWDYGFQCIDLAEHPSVADNFQNGYVPAGLFITAQNESSAIAILLIRILDADYVHSNKDFSDGVKNILVKYLSNETFLKIRDYYKNPSSYISEVKRNDTKYMGNNIKLDEVTANVAKYVSTRYELTKLSQDKLVSLLSEVQNQTNYSIRYFAADVRMFPFNWYNKGIFYAPVKLTDQRVNENGDSLDYLETVAVLENGNTKKISDLTKNDKVKSYQLTYKDNFYRTMFYNAYVGYSGEDIGQANDKFGIPGISGNARQYPPMQGWMMKNFRIVYRTTYWNPYPQEDVQNHTDAWRQITPEEFLIYSQTQNGTTDPRSGLYNGVQFLEYYEGINISGRVLAGSNGVPNVYVTAIDDFGISHDLATTDKDGYYQITAPFGLTVNINNIRYSNVTLIASVGQLNQFTKMGQTTLNATTLTNATRDLARIGYRMTNININLTTKNVNGSVFWDLDNDNQYNATKDELINEGKVVFKIEKYVYNATIVNGTYNESFPYGYHNIYVNIDGHETPSTNLPILNIESEKNFTGKNIGIKQGILTGTIKYENSTPVSNMTFKLIDLANNKEYNLTTNETGYYKIDRLLFGNYTIEINEKNFMKISEFVSIGGSTTKDIKLVRSVEVKGSINIRNATIEFIDVNGEKTLVKAMDNTYSINLTKGNYTVFLRETRNYKTYAYLGKITLGDEFVNFNNITAERAVKIYGYITAFINNLFANISTGITFEQNGLTLSTNSNKTGYYEIYIPKGNYSVRINYVQNTTSYIYLEKLNANESKLQNITLNRAILLSGKTYWDKDRDGNYDGGEEVNNVEMTITDGFNTLKISSKGGGAYSVLLAQNRTYYITLNHQNYNTVEYNISIANTDIVWNWTIVPKKVIVNGTTYFDENRNGTYDSGEEKLYDENGQNANPIIWFNATVGNVKVNTTAINGSYSIELLPLDYDISAYTDTVLVKYNYKTTSSSRMKLTIGKNFERNISFDKLITINGTVYIGNNTQSSVDIEFTPIEAGAEKTGIRTGADGKYSAELKNGTYGVYAKRTQGTTTSAFLGYIALNSPTEYNFTLNNSYEIRGIVYWDRDGNSTVEDDVRLSARVKFISKETNGVEKVLYDTIENRVRVYLPSGNYTIRIDEFSVSNVQYEKYEANITIINTTLTHNIKLTPKNILLNFTTYWDENGNKKFDSGEEKVANLTLTFKYANETYNKIIKTNETGVYANLSLRSGPYTLTISPFANNDTNVKYDTIYKLPNIDSTTKNQEIYLSKTIKVNGTVYYIENLEQKYPEKTKMVFKDSGEKETILNVSAVYSVYLKPDKYSLNVSSLINGKEYFYAEKNIEIFSYRAIIVNLLPLYAIRGEVLFNNETVNGSALPSNANKIKFLGENYFETTFDENGSYTTYLIGGNYTVSISYSLKENKTFGNMTYNYTYRYTYEENISVNSDMEKNFTLVKEQKFGVKIIADTVKNVLPSENYTLQIKIKNIGIEKDSFTAKVLDITENWNATLLNATTIELNATEEKTLDLSVKVPNATRDQIHKGNNTTGNITLFAASLSGENWNATLNITFNIKLPDYEISNVRVETQKIENRRPITITATLKELQNVTTPKGAPEVTIKFYIDDKETDEINVAVAYENETNVSSIWTTAPGEHKITVKVIAPTVLDEISTENNADSISVSVPSIKWFNLMILIVGIVLAIVVPIAYLRFRKPY